MVILTLYGYLDVARSYLVVKTIVVKMNLYNCRIGIYANLNSSETIIKQRTGRLLRHPYPIIIIPYYKGTREEELVNKMLEDYNPELVKTVNLVEEIQL